MKFRIGDIVEWHWYDYVGGCPVAGGHGIIIEKDGKLVVKQITPYTIIYQDLDKLIEEHNKKYAKLWRVKNDRSIEY